jgi:4'-phosphopantetheinyl transferase
MITCCYTEIKEEWTQQELSGKLTLLPERFRLQSMRKRQWIDRQLTISGKLLLLWLLKERKSALTLEGIKTTSYQRLYFEDGPDFNIAHSGNMVACCMTDTGRVGIDIEAVKEIDLSDFTDYFTPNEWKRIGGCPNVFDVFYDFWTRKEAVLKAIGTGLHTPLSAVDVSGESLLYDHIVYHLRAIPLAAGYKCHIASTDEGANVRIVRVEL